MYRSLLAKRNKACTSVLKELAYRFQRFQKKFLFHFYLVISGYKGIVTSPDYPYSYLKNKRIRRWKIKVPDHFLKIHFRVAHLDLTASESCEKGDFLKIYEKAEDGSMVLRFFSCPNQHKLPSFYINGRIAFIEFITDVNFKADRPGRGFKISFEASLLGQFSLLLFLYIKIINISSTLRTRLIKRRRNVQALLDNHFDFCQSSTLVRLTTATNIV